MQAPYIMYVEVLECEDVHTTSLPPKLLDSSLQKHSDNSPNGSVSNLSGVLHLAAEQCDNVNDISPKSSSHMHTDTISTNSAPAFLHQTTTESSAAPLPPPTFQIDNAASAKFDCWSINS